MQQVGLKISCWFFSVPDRVYIFLPDWLFFQKINSGFFEGRAGFHFLKNSSKFLVEEKSFRLKKNL
jgi:hypothetical protein